MSDTGYRGAGALERGLGQGAGRPGGGAHAAPARRGAAFAGGAGRARPGGPLHGCLQRSVVNATVLCP